MSKEFNQFNLQDYRKVINKIDNKLLNLLDERMKFSKEIGNYKKEKGLPVHHPEREKVIINKLSKNIDEKIVMGNDCNLPKNMIDEIWKVIFKYSKLVQN